MKSAKTILFYKTRKALPMLTYSFAQIGKKPLYEALYGFIREDIRTGTIKAGERLPSRRALSAQLGVSAITVEAAYGQLIAEGYCHAIPKRGVFASALGNAAPLRPATPPVTSEAPRPPQYRYDFATGNVRPEDFPFDTWRRLMRRIQNEQAADLLSPVPAQGAPVLRDAIAAHLSAFRGLSVPAENIVVGAGSEQLTMLLPALLGRDRTYCVEDPGYGRIRRAYEASGANCVACPLDGAGIAPETLRGAGGDILHISPAHHFPTGLIMPISRRYELLAWAAEQEGRHIVEDDYDSELRMTGRMIPTLMSIDAAGRVLYMNTFSKTLTPTIRVSYLVLPDALAARFRERLGFLSSPVSSFEQYTLAAFIAEGCLEKHINQMRSKYRRRRERLLAVLKSAPLRGKLEIQERGAGLHFLLHFHTEKSDEALTAALAAASIRMTPLSAYYARGGREAEHTFVMNYTALDPALLTEALATRLASCL